jgi:hypothetical protein
MMTDCIADIAEEEIRVAAEVATLCQVYILHSAGAQLMDEHRNLHLGNQSMI